LQRIVMPELTIKDKILHCCILAGARRMLISP
jgi:hypothetical protein